MYHEGCGWHLYTSKQSKVECRPDREWLSYSGHEHNSSMVSVVPSFVFQVFSQSMTRLTGTLCNFSISWFDMVLNTLRGVLKGQKEDHKQHRKHWNTGIRHSSGVENYCRHQPKHLHKYLYTLACMIFMHPWVIRSTIAKYYSLLTLDKLTNGIDTKKGIARFLHTR